VNLTAKLLLVSLAAVALSCVTAAISAQDAGDGEEHPGYNLFVGKCQSCHTVGGGKTVGPDLKGLQDRLKNGLKGTDDPKEWFVKFVRDPKGMKDAYIREVRKKNHGDPDSTQMAVSVVDVDDTSLKALWDFIIKGGPGLKYEVVEIDGSEENVAYGKKLFTGQKKLAAGGPACIACHTVGNLEGLGGGTIAKDLTDAHMRLGDNDEVQGNQAIYGLLQNPAFPLMAEVFENKPLTDAERNALTAYLAESAKGEPAGSSRFFILVYALVGAAVAVLMLDLAWLSRFRNVRKDMVGDSE